MYQFSGAGEQPLPLAIQYPDSVKSASAKKEFKHKMLRENPETLTADFSQIGDRCIPTNLLLYTEYTEAWHSAICKHYRHFKKNGICNGRQITVYEEENSDSTLLTVNIYHNGTVMLQGSEASLSSVQRDFGVIKALAEDEKPIKITKITNLISTSETNILEAEEEGKSQPQEDCAVFHKELENTVSLMREMLSLQEVEMVELKELVLSHQTHSKPLQHLQEELSQMKASVLELKREMQVLQQDRETLKRELGAVREELEVRDQTIHSLREQLQSQNTHKHQGQPPVTPTPNETRAGQSQQKPTTTPPETTAAKNPQLPTPTPQVHTPTPQPTAERDTIPGPSATQTQPLKEGTSQPASKATNKTNNHRDAEIIILMDSNGKFLNEQQLFPNHEVVKLWCPNTDSAFTLLQKKTLGNPSHIIVHTGTNDLRKQQERVAESLRRVAEQATQTFPSSKIIISTILPRTDFHPQTIQQINAAISRGCGKMPNVHIAHHPTLHLDNLHDHVHLQKGSVGILARKLKDVAFGRSPDGPPQVSRRPSSLHPAGLYFSPPLRRPTTQRPPHHQQHNPPPRPRTPSAGQVNPPLRPHRPSPAPQQQSPAQQQRYSYAAAVKGETRANNTDMGEIKRLLSLICTRLMGEV